MHSLEPDQPLPVLAVAEHPDPGGCASSFARSRVKHDIEHGIVEVEPLEVCGVLVDG